jgi:hypothetical protein
MVAITGLSVPDEYFDQTTSVVENALAASFDTTAGPLEYFDPTGSSDAVQRIPAAKVDLAVQNHR